MLPFQDAGRELNTPVRLLAGERLYRDVACPYGPLPAYLDAGAFLLFGRDLDVLIAFRTFLALLGIEALRRLSGRLVADARLSSALTTALVAACAFGGGGGAYPFPYAGAALEAVVGTWWGVELALRSSGPAGSLAAGLVAGLAAGTKMEVAPAALVPLALALFLRRPKREAMAGTGLAVLLWSAAFGTPLALYGSEILVRQGYLVAFQLPKIFRELYLREVLLGGMSPAQFAAGGWMRIFIPSGIYAALTIALLSRRWFRGPVAAAVAFAAAVATGLRPRNDALDVLLPLAAFLAAGHLVILFAERRDAAARTALLAPACVALAMLPALSRQPLFIHNDIYAGFTTPLALLVSLAWLARRAAAPGPVAGLFLGIACAQGLGHARMLRSVPMVFTELPGARLYLPPDESAFLQEAAKGIVGSTPPGSFVGVFPEPGFLLFVTGRRNPFAHEDLYPGYVDEKEEEEMVRRLREHRPPLILVTNRPFPEYGELSYGRGLLDRVFAEVRRLYEPAGTMGAPPAVPHVTRDATSAQVLRVRNR